MTCDTSPIHPSARPSESNGKPRAGAGPVSEAIERPRVLFRALPKGARLVAPTSRKQRKGPYAGRKVVERSRKAAHTGDAPPAGITTPRRPGNGFPKDAERLPSRSRKSRKVSESQVGNGKALGRARPPADSRPLSESTAFLSETWRIPRLSMPFRKLEIPRVARVLVVRLHFRYFSKAADWFFWKDGYPFEKLKSAGFLLFQEGVAIAKKVVRGVRSCSLLPESQDVYTTEL